MGLFSRKKASPRYFSACNLMPGPEGYGAAALDERGQIVWQRTMPARGHALELSPDGALCAVIDRKPGAAITLCRPGDRRARRARLGQAGIPRRLRVLVSEGDVQRGGGV